MKHFGANLTGSNNEVDGTAEISTLTIATGDRFIITDRNSLSTNSEPVGSTDGNVAGGLYITGGTDDVGTTAVLAADDHRYYLDGKGQEKDLSGLIGANLFLSGTSLTIRNNAGTNISNTITLPSGGGGGGTTGAADYNENLNRLPVLSEDGLQQFDFVDSLISQSGGTITRPTIDLGVVTTTVPANTAATVLISGFDDGQFQSLYGGGVSTTILIDGVEYTGTLTAVSSSAGSFVAASNFTTELTQNDVVTVQIAAGTYTPNTVTLGTDTGHTVVVNGNLQVLGTTTSVDSQNTRVTDTFIELGFPATDNTEVGSNNTVGINAVLAFDASNVVTQQESLRYNDTAKAWQVTVGDVDGINSTYENILSGGGITGGAGVAVNTGVSPSDARINDPVIAADITAMGGLQFSASGNAGTLELNVESFTAASSPTNGAGGLSLNSGALTISNESIGERHLQATTLPTNGQLLSSNANGRFIWVDAPTSSGGTVTKATIAFTKAATTATNTGFIRINRDVDANRLNTSSNHGLPAASATNGYTVQVYDSSTTGVLTQVIPEEIMVGIGGATVNDPAGNELNAGDIVIVVGNSALTGVAVIKE